MTIKERIKKLANSEGLSLPKLEEELGFGGGTISRWETSMPAADKLAKIADRYNVTVDFLLGREVAEKESPNVLAAHFEGEEYTEEEMDEIKKFAEYVKSKRKS